MTLQAPLLPCPWIPQGQPLAKAPTAIPPTWEGPVWRSPPNLLLLDWNPNQGQKRDQIWWAIPANGSQQRWAGEATLTGGKRSEPVGGSPWENTLWGNATLMLKHSTMPNGRWQPLGCPLPSRRPQVGGMPQPGSAGCSPRISCPLQMPPVPGISWPWGRKRPWP